MSSLQARYGIIQVMAARLIHITRRDEPVDKEHFTRRKLWYQLTMPAMTEQLRNYRRNRPTCPLCKCTMVLLRVTPGDDNHEAWLYRWPGCGQEQTIIVEAL